MCAPRFFSPATPRQRRRWAIFPCCRPTSTAHGKDPIRPKGLRQPPTPIQKADRKKRQSFHHDCRGGPQAPHRTHLPIFEKGKGLIWTPIVYGAFEDMIVGGCQPFPPGIGWPKHPGQFSPHFRFRSIGAISGRPPGLAVHGPRGGDRGNVGAYIIMCKPIPKQKKPKALARICPHIGSWSDRSSCRPRGTQIKSYRAFGSPLKTTRHKHRAPTFKGLFRPAVRALSYYSNPKNGAGGANRNAAHPKNGQNVVFRNPPLLHSWQTSMPKPKGVTEAPRLFGGFAKESPKVQRRRPRLRMF